MADLNNGTYWSETDASNNSAPPNGWPEGMMPTGVNDAARADKGALKRFWGRINPTQTVAPAGGVWTFAAANALYPQVYADGEIYAFNAAANSAAGDQFRINALPAKPLYCVETGTWQPIKAYDIRSGQRVFVCHNGSLSAGAGGFELIHPSPPVANDGTGGATVLGALTVGGNLSVGGTGSVAGNFTIGGGVLSLRSQVVLAEDAPNAGFTTIYDNSASSSIHLGNPATLPVNLYRQTSHQFQGRGGTPTYATIDGSGINVTGSVSAGSATFANIALTGTGTALSMPSGSILASTATLSSIAINGTGTALFVPNGNASIGGTLTAAAMTATGLGSFGSINASGSITTSGLTVNGAASVTAGITAGSMLLSGPGTTLYLPNGNAQLDHALTVNTIEVSGTGNTAINLANGGISTPRLYVSSLVQITGTAYALVLTAGGISINAASVFGGLTEFNTNVRIYGGGTALTLTVGTAAKPGGGTWADSSDIRTKEAVADYTQGLAAVLQLRPVSFRKNGRGGTAKDGKTYIGLVADDVVPVMPEMIGRIAERLDPDDEDTTEILTLDATALIYCLTNAVKELAAEIDTLKRAPHAAD